MSAVAARRLPRRIRVDSSVVVLVVLPLVIVVGAVLVGLSGRSFFSAGNISAVLTGTSVLGFFAIGQTLVVLAGGLDLSVPYVASLSSLLAAGVMAGQVGNIVPGVLAALAMAIGVGVINGVLVSVFRVNAFIATLGVGLMISGYLATNYNGSFGETPFEFRLVGATGIGPVPVSTILMVAFAALVALLLTKTRIGHHVFATGGEPNVARMSGIRNEIPLIVAHMLCSVFAGLAGLLLASRLGVGSPTVGSQGGYDLLSIAAVVLGGTLLSGGRGTILGTLGAVLILAVVSNVMGVLQVNPFIQDAVRGILIVAAVAVYARRTTLRRVPRFGGGTATALGTRPAEEGR